MYVKINNTYSLFRILLSGVLQGSILGSILLLFFFKDSSLFVTEAKQANFPDEFKIQKFPDKFMRYKKILKNL